jgi:predicted MFS family arabinose efflux permease
VVSQVNRQAGPEPSPEASGGMLHAVRVSPAFRTLMLGTVWSSAAFWMYQVAVGWLALALTDSPAFVGLAGFAGGIPLLLVALPAGVIIDRYDRRTVLLAAQIGVLIISAVFVLLVGTDRIGRGSVLVLVAAYGTMMSFVFPTRTAIVPSLVAREDLANAVALNSATQNATRVVGPSLAGVLIGVLGVAETFAAAAVMQSLALMATLRLPQLAPTGGPKRGASGWSSMAVGWRVVRQRPHLGALIMLALAPTVLVMPFLNLMPVFARDELGLGSAGLGVLLAATGVGTVVGSLAVARYPGGATRLRRQVATAVAFASSVIGFTLAPNVGIAIAVLFVAGGMSAAFLAMNQTALQLGVEDEVRGRVLSIYLLTWGLLPVGQLLVGTLAGQIGTPVAMMTACMLALISIAAIAWRFPAAGSTPSTS